VGWVVVSGVAAIIILLWLLGAAWSSRGEAVAAAIHWRSEYDDLCNLVAGGAAMHQEALHRALDHLRPMEDEDGDG
jgi:hypothetical protein